MKENQQSNEMKTFIEMLISGFNNLHNNYPYIDKLNVFPVPDGDTGTNMNLTTANGINEIGDNEFNSIGEVLNTFSRGLIMGARGNSGVIFSQIIKGFYQALRDAELPLTVEDWKKAFERGTKVAYKAVMKPIEGTILTVIRETSEGIANIPSETSMKDFWSKLLEYANESLENTPNVLKVLKDVGVVDSGGYGLVKFFEGISKRISNNKIVPFQTKLEINNGGNVEMDIQNKEFGYCTEAVVLLNKEWIKKLTIAMIQEQLQIYGNTSTVIIIDEDILKVHTHALNPGQVITFLQQYGDFQNIKIENMNLQSDYQVKKNKNSSHKDKALSTKKTDWTETSTLSVPRLLNNDVMTIAVVSSDQLKRYFEKELGVDLAINAGSTMNPSTKDFLEAIKAVDAKNVFILPNNSNVLLAAKQAEKEETKTNVFVIPTKTIQQGMVAYLNFDPSLSPAKNNVVLSKAIKNVISINVTQASKDSNMDDVTIKEGDFISVVDGKVENAIEELTSVFEKIFTKYINNRVEIITIFIGQDAKAKDVSWLQKYLDENFDVEYELIEGDQKVYDYLISIE